MTFALPPKRRPLRRVSPKRAAEAKARAAVIASTHERSGWRCEARDLVPEVTCWGRLDCDESAPRSLYPGGHLDLDDTQSLCRAHHTFKELNPERARALGLMRPAPPVRQPLYLKERP